MARDRTLVFSTETGRVKRTIRPPPLSATAGFEATREKRPGWENGNYGKRPAART